MPIIKGSGSHLTQPQKPSFQDMFKGMQDSGVLNFSGGCCLGPAGLHRLVNGTQNMTVLSDCTEWAEIMRDDPSGK